MNFLKSIFSPRRVDPRSPSHQGVTPTSDRKVTPKENIGIRQTVAFEDILDSEDGTEANLGRTVDKDSALSNILKEKVDTQHPNENPAMCFQETARALRHIKTGREWELWCTKLFASSTDPCDKVRFAQFVSEKLQGTRRDEECHDFVHQCVNIFIVKSAVLQLEEYTNIFDSQRAGKGSQGDQFTAEAPFFILRILFLDAYHFQLLIRKLKVNTSALDATNEIEVGTNTDLGRPSLNYISPTLSTLTESKILQLLLSKHIAFAVNYVTACEKKADRLLGSASEIQNVIAQIRFLCCSNVFTLTQKLQYPSNGDLCGLMLSISGAWEKGFLRHAFQMPVSRGQNQEMIIMPCHTSFTRSKHWKTKDFTMTPEFTAKMAQAIFSTGLMYLNSYQQARTSYQKKLHKDIDAYFKGVEFGFDTKECIQSRRHALLAASIDERLWQLGKSLKESPQPVFDPSLCVSCIQAAIANFEWLLRIREAGIISSQTGLFSSKTATFLFQVADFLHFDGMDAEALFLYSFAASFTETDSETHRDSANRIFSTLVRHELYIQNLACGKSIAASELFRETSIDPQIMYFLYKHQTGEITSGDLANSMKPLLAKFIPFLQDADSTKNSSKKYESVFISSTNEAHDICQACCVLGDVFLVREDPDYAIRFFLAVVRIVTSTSTLFSMRFFAMACLGIGRATAKLSLRRSIHQSMYSLLFGCVENPESRRTQWKQHLQMASAIMCTHLALELNTNAIPAAGQMCYTMSSSILNSAGDAILTPQRVHLCGRALRVSEFIRENTIEKAISALTVESFCPFTPALFRKCITHQELTEVQKDTILQCVSSHHCYVSCSAVDQRSVIYALLDCFFSSRNEKLAKLLIENVGMSFNALNERLHENITSDPPRTVSVCCMVVDSMLKNIWIARADSFKSDKMPPSDHTRYTLVRLPMKTEILDLVETLQNLTKKASKDIAFPESKNENDNVNSRKYFWRQRKYFDNEAGLVLRRMERVLGCWQAFFLGLPNIEYGKIHDFLHFRTLQILRILRRTNVNFPFGILSEYASHILLSYTVPIGHNGNIDVSQKDLSSIVSDISKFIQDLVGANSLCVAQQAELSACVQELIREWARAHIRPKQDSSDSSLSDFHRRKVWLLMDQSIILKFPWEMMNIYQTSNAPIVRIPSLRFANSVCAAGELRNSHKKFSDVAHRLTSTPSLFYCLNPSGDIENSQQRFFNLFQSIPEWSGIVGSYDSKKCVDGLKSKEVYLYIGHGSGERCTPRHLLVDFTGPNTEKQETHSFMTLLMGCSSCAIQNGPLSSPYTFLTAGNLCFLGTLWDVTDGEIDRFTTSLICDALIPAGIGPLNKNGQNSSSYEAATTACIRQLFPADPKDDRGSSPSNRMKEIHLSVNAARYACKLPYLTGASVVMYGV